MSVTTAQNIPSFEDWSNFSTSNRASLEKRRKRDEGGGAICSPSNKPKTIESVIDPFFSTIRAINEDPASHVRKTILGAFDPHTLEMKYEEAFQALMGGGVLPGSVNLLEHKEVFKRYIDQLALMVQPVEGNPLHKVKMEWLKNSVLRLKSEIDLIYSEMIRLIPVISSLFQEASATFSAKVFASLEGKPRVPFVLMHEFKHLKEDLQSMESNFNAKIVTEFSTIRELRDKWKERSDLFAAQYRYNHLAEEDVEKLKTTGAQEGRVVFTDLLTSKRIAFSGNLDEIKADIAWIKNFFSIVAEADTLCLAILRDGICKQYLQLFQTTKSALEEVLNKI